MAPSIHYAQTPPVGANAGDIFIDSDDRAIRVHDGVDFKTARAAQVTLSGRGTVTQITSTETGVTVNASSGTITTFALDGAAAAEDGPFTVTNNEVAANDTVVVSIKSYGGGGTPIPWVSAVGAGSFAITITNVHASAALDALIVLNFAVIKSV